MRRLLVCSIGNPAPYANTFHSAGHAVLKRLHELLSQSPATAVGPFARDRSLGGGRVAASPAAPLALWESASLMNVSGKGVAAAWRAWRQRAAAAAPGSSDDVGLVVLHDELESPLGKLKVRTGGSARGHNGLKSCIQCLQGQEFTRIGIGIGRPQSRDPKDVANYVLRKMTSQEKAKIEGSAEEVLRILQKLAVG